VIVPDEKDWTWVVTRPCPDCAFDASSTNAQEVSALVRQSAATWQALLEAGLIRPGRPDDETWSNLEYACHVRDVFRRYLGRLELMLTEVDPLFPNWDQDATAVEDAYEQQDPASVVEELGHAAEELAACLDRIDSTAWHRPGRRSDGAAFTVDSIARYMIHDPIHHVWDVTHETAAG
jgi:hypothetical protein